MSTTGVGDVTAQRTADGEVRILHADARIAVSQELLDDADPRVVAEFVRTVPPSPRGTR